MKRLNKIRPMMIFVLILQIFAACSADHHDELIAENEEEINGVFAAATIYYEKDGDKYAIVYHKNGEKRTFNNGKKIGQIEEPAPDPITVPDEVENPDNVEIIEDEAWTDEEAIDQTAPESETATPPTQEISAEVQYWKEMFDAEWIEEDFRTDYTDALTRSKSGNLNAEYYNLGKYIDGLQQIWQATGDNQYLDMALELIYNTVNDAVDVGNGFKGWPAADGKQTPLWDTYYWRHVTSIIRILDQSPNLRASNAEYQKAYEELLAFSEKNIWDRYVAMGDGKIYRGRTHMASHWARIGMELYIVTGNPKYKEVFDNISFGTMPNEPSNLRDRMYNNPNQPDAIIWDQVWDVNQGDYIQDTAHAEAIVSFIANAYDNNMYWTLNDINGLINTLTKVVWTNGSDLTLNVDGSGGYERQWRCHEWLNLGRYSQEIQNKIKSDYISSTEDENIRTNGTQAIGIAALNAKVLEDGAPVYPEQ